MSYLSVDSNYLISKQFSTIAIRSLKQYANSLDRSLVVSSVVLEELRSHHAELLSKVSVSVSTLHKRELKSDIDELHAKAVNLQTENFEKFIKTLEDLEQVDNDVSDYEQMMNKVHNRQTPVKYHQKGRYSGFKDYLIQSSLEKLHGDVLFVTDNTGDFQKTDGFCPIVEKDLIQLVSDKENENENETEDKVLDERKILHNKIKEAAKHFEYKINPLLEDVGQDIVDQFTDRGYVDDIEISDVELEAPKVIKIYSQDDYDYVEASINCTYRVDYTTNFEWAHPWDKTVSVSASAGEALKVSSEIKFIMNWDEKTNSLEIEDYEIVHLDADLLEEADPDNLDPDNFKMTDHE